MVAMVLVHWRNSDRIPDSQTDKQKRHKQISLFDVERHFRDVDDTILHLGWLRQQGSFVFWGVGVVWVCGAKPQQHL